MEKIYIPSTELPYQLLEELQNLNIVAVYPFTWVYIESLQQLYELGKLFEHFGYRLNVGPGYFYVTKVHDT